MQKIFISYSRKDLDFVRKLAEDLETAGYDVWWDLTDLQGGDDWPRAIPAAIEASQRVIIVLSPNSAASDWVEKEYTYALSLRKKIIPLMLVPSSVPFALNTIHFVDFTSDDYVGNFNHLLTALGHTGERPVVTPPKPTLPMMLRKYAIPIGIGAVILLAILAMFVFPPILFPTSTPSGSPTTPGVIFTDTNTPTVSPTISATATFTPSLTGTSTPTSLTPATPPSGALRLPICIYLRDGRANVRAGPGSDYEIVATVEAKGTNCFFFSSHIRNKDQEIWFQFAEGEPFAGRWISADVVAATDLRLLPLPICIYDPGEIAEIHEDPDEQSGLAGNPLKADGTNCPFFDVRKTNGEETWYQFARDQKENQEKFKDYIRGWIREDSLVVHTLDLPAVTLTSTPTPSDTPTSTPTSTRTPTPTPTDTPTVTPTSTSTPTDTPTPTPTDTPVPTAMDTETPLPTETLTPE
ncbi:MAG: TIR domain-containing protein [Anaerolineales bacterium]|nr:TIR domain-containing protein [Anaerolineales bacterium]